MDQARPNWKPPKLPRPGHVVAALLEITIVADFAHHRDLLGLAVCAAYAWFSATWALFSLPADE